MGFTKFAFVALAFSSAVTAGSRIEPAVQPGGDIPPAFHQMVPPVPNTQHPHRRSLLEGIGGRHDQLAR